MGRQLLVLAQLPAEHGRPVGIDHCWQTGYTFLVNTLGETLMRPLLYTPLLSLLVAGCSVVAVADAAVTVVATTVKVGAKVVETTVDVAAAGVKAVAGTSEDKDKDKGKEKD